MGKDGKGVFAIVILFVAVTLLSSYVSSSEEVDK